MRSLPERKGKGARLARVSRVGRTGTATDVIICRELASRFPPNGPYNQLPVFFSVLSSFCLSLPKCLLRHRRTHKMSYPYASYILMCLLGNFLYQTQDRKQLKEGRIYLGLQLEKIKSVTVRRHGKGILTTHLSTPGSKNSKRALNLQPPAFSTWTLPPKAQLLKQLHQLGTKCSNPGSVGDILYSTHNNKEGNRSR